MKATKQYEVNGVHRWTEEDVFENGCIPNSGVSELMDVKVKADTIDELIHKLFNSLYFDYDKEAIELNACDEEGRLDIQIMENMDGQEADKHERALWKKGQRRLWLGNYTAHVELVTREQVTI